MLKEITKRDGSIVEFDPNKINLAIKKAFIAARGESDDELIGKLTKAVVRYLKANAPEEQSIKAKLSFYQSRQEKEQKKNEILRKDERNV